MKKKKLTQEQLDLVMKAIKMTTKPREDRKR